MEHWKFLEIGKITHDDAVQREELRTCLSAEYRHEIPPLKIGEKVAIIGLRNDDTRALTKDEIARLFAAATEGGKSHQLQALEQAAASMGVNIPATTRALARTLTA